MNHIYRIIWCRARNAWMVASELARAEGRTHVRRRGASPTTRLTPMAAALLLAVFAPARAIDHYWDINDLVAGTGSPTPHGFWSTGGLSLSLNAGGTVAVTPRTTTTADRLFFAASTDATGAYTVTVMGTQSIGRLTFQEGTVNLTGGTINFGNVSGLIEGDATPDRISSVLTGTNGVRFSGGTITLDGAAPNTYTGTTVVGGSGLAQASVILAASGGNAFSGNFVQMGGGGAYNTGGSVTLGAAHQINDVATLQMTSTHYSGSSVFSLNGFDETIGGISMSKVGGASSVTFRNGAATDATVTLVGSGTYSTANGDRTFGRSITNGGAGRLHVVVALAGSGVQVFSGSNVNYTGTTTVTSGTLQLVNASTWASGVTLNGGMLELQQNAAGAPTYAGAATRTHTNVIGGTGGILRKTGNGTVILTGVNTYRGATDIRTGTLQAGSTSAFGLDSAVTLANTAGANLNLNGFANSIGSLTGGGATGGNVQLGAATLTTGGNHLDSTYAGVITGTGGLVKVGLGTQSLTGVNAYAGATSVNAGTLQLGAMDATGGATGSLGPGAVNIAAGGTLAFARSNAHTVANLISGAGTLAHVGSGTTTLAANNAVGNLRIGAGTLDVDAQLDSATVEMGSGSLNIDGTVQGAGGTPTAFSGIAGTAGTVRINNGAILMANGDLGDGADVLDVAGTLDTSGGIFDLGDGDDTFVVHDGTVVIGNVSGGGGLDSRVYDISTSASVGALTEFEGLTKSGVGVLNLTGPGTTVLADVQVLEGTLSVGAATNIAGVTTATVRSGAVLDLGGGFGFTGGSDRLTIGGSITGTAVLDLLGGDDVLTIQDGADLGGLTRAIEGGAGTDTFNADISGNAVLGGATGFERLAKTNVGSLIVAGPAASSFSAVEVAGGTVNIGAAGSIDGVVTTTVAEGASLQVDGRHTGSAGADTMTVAGVVRGAGTVNLLGGDDWLALNDSADVGGLASVLDGGDGFDTVQATIAGNATFAPLANFEALVKDGAGTLALSDNHRYVHSRVDAGTLAVDTVLETDNVAMGQGVFDIGGTVQAGGGTRTAFTGIAGTAGTVRVASGAMLRANGDLGDGADVLDVVGTLDTGGGVFNLGDGDDMFTVHDDSVVIGVVSGGGGLDSRVYDIGTTARVGALLEFEGLTKTGAGVLHLTGPSITELADVQVLAGTLAIGTAAQVSRVNSATIASGAVLDLAGAFGFTDGNDRLTVGGSITGTALLDLLGGDDVLTIEDGAGLDGLARAIDGGAGSDTLNADIAGMAALGGATGFEALVKSNVGTLAINGPADSVFDAVRVQGGTLWIAGGASVDPQSTVVASGATLTVDGRYSGTAGADTFDVAGTVSGGGVIGLLDGDDLLTIRDGADLANLGLAIDGGTGIDTVQATIAVGAHLGPTASFENLVKDGAGTLTLSGDHAYVTTRVDSGIVTVANGARLSSQNTAVAAGASMEVQGSFSATAGNDTLMVSGRLDGAFALGAGDDMADFFAGSNWARVSGLSGGEGSDALGFHALALTRATLPAFDGWETVQLREGSRLDLDGTLDLGGATLFVDATSRVFADSGARLLGHLHNGGRVTVGAHRLGISGNYSAGSALDVAISPASSTGGGLDIGGDVSGSTDITLSSDGSDATQHPASILVIASPADNPATPGRFVIAGAGDGVVRVDGSVLPWSFGQAVDNNWYLRTEATQLLPEIPAYAALPGIGQTGVQQSVHLLSDRLSGVRDDIRRCGAREERGYADPPTRHCDGAWAVATTSEIEMGADPGAAFSGDTLSIHAGIDTRLDERDTRTSLGGLFVGFQRGNYWTTGELSSSAPVGGEANVRMDTPAVGMYGSVLWTMGTYVDVSLVAQRPDATVTVADGFKETMLGNSLTLTSQLGRRWRLRDGWTLEPQLQVGVTVMHWGDEIDASGKHLVLDDDVLGVARVAIRAERDHTTAGGARLNPWMTLSLQNTFGEEEAALAVLSTGAASQALVFPNHDFGTFAALDLGLEAQVNTSTSLFGALSYGQSVSGSDSEERQFNLGVRVRW